MRWIDGPPRRGPLETHFLDSFDHLENPTVSFRLLGNMPFWAPVAVFTAWRAEKRKEQIIPAEHPNSHLIILDGGLDF